MKVLLAAAESTPYAKTGGLADVLGALHVELRALGLDARLVMPLYRNVRDRFDLEDTGIEVKVPLGAYVQTGRIFLHNKNSIFIECDEFYGREGLYGTAWGEFGDNSSRYIFFCKAVLQASRALGFTPDVVHCHDWHTGLIPLYLKSIYKGILGPAASLFTVHNLGYQGRFPATILPLTGIGMEMFTPQVLEYYGDLNIMKAGIVAADAVSTVSVNYGREILTEQYGFGLDGVLKTREADLFGITNGIDCDVWDPMKDESIRQNYGAADLAGKKRCKGHLVERCSFKKKSAPLIGMVGRISEQKGFDIFLGAAGGVLQAGANIVILGTGEEKIHSKLRELDSSSPAISVNIGFDEKFAHQVYAGADMLLIPSRYEPCGLTQMIAMRYATVPTAKATGGLVDTIEDYDTLSDKGTGFLFRDHTPDALVGCVKRALCAYADKNRWKRIMQRGLSRDFSWKGPARKYVSLYKDLAKKATG